MLLNMFWLGNFNLGPHINAGSLGRAADRPQSGHDRRSTFFFWFSTFHQVCPHWDIPRCGTASHATKDLLAGNRKYHGFSSGSEVRYSSSIGLVRANH